MFKALVVIYIILNIFHKLWLEDKVKELLQILDKIKENK